MTKHNLLKKSPILTIIFYLLGYILKWIPFNFAKEIRPLGVKKQEMID